MISNDKYYFDSIASIFCFGKYKGESLWSVILKDKSYIYWCVNNISDFIIDRDALSQIRELFPELIIPLSFSTHIYDSSETCDDYDDNDEGWYEYENKDCSTYERYAGSYAQDVMGYSDDDIDIIFDGDPWAYWNIV